MLRDKFVRNEGFTDVAGAAAGAEGLGVSGGELVDKHMIILPVHIIELKNPRPSVDLAALQVLPK